jgi:hypothetical protein
MGGAGAVADTRADRADLILSRPIVEIVRDDYSGDVRAMALRS